MSPAQNPLSATSWLELKRQVRFCDTDAAGVVHFANLMVWLHQAWEESLEIFGLDAGAVFPGARTQTPKFALPIVHCNADFRAPLQVGDIVTIRLSPLRLSKSSFEVASEVIFDNQIVARGCLKHLAINPNSRQRCGLPHEIERWLEASSLGRIQPL